MAIFECLSRWVLAGATFALMGVAAAPAQAPSLAMLDRLEKGRGQLTERGQQTAFQLLCLGDARQMIQIYHPRRHCSRYVIEDRPNSVTVHYNCPGAGHGRSAEPTSELQSLM